MKNLEVTTDKRFNNLSEECYNLQVYKSGTHNVEMFTQMGRGFAEKKNTPVGRIPVGKNDIKKLSVINKCNYEFSLSGKTCYLVNGNELQREIVKLISQ